LLVAPRTALAATRLAAATPAALALPPRVCQKYLLVTESTLPVLCRYRN